MSQLVHRKNTTVLDLFQTCLLVRRTITPETSSIPNLGRQLLDPGAQRRVCRGRLWRLWRGFEEAGFAIWVVAFMGGGAGRRLGWGLAGGIGLGLGLTLRGAVALAGAVGAFGVAFRGAVGLVELAVLGVCGGGGGGRGVVPLVVPLVVEMGLEMTMRVGVGGRSRDRYGCGGRSESSTGEVVAAARDCNERGVGERGEERRPGCQLVGMVRDNEGSCWEYAVVERGLGVGSADIRTFHWPVS